jgi:hypothetical protein
MYDMKRGVPAKKHRTSTCKYCSSTFACFDKKASICESCNEVITFQCRCGCGTEVTRIKFKSITNQYYRNHDKRGKTYKEIYGTDSPGCGFKLGLDNVNFTKPKYKRFKYTNSIGEKFSSTLEVKFSEFLIKHNIPYKTEIKFPMLGGKLKIVDFLIDDIIVEITGFAYSTWQMDFVSKIQTLRKSVDNPILILTYRYNMDDQLKWPLLKQCSSLDVFFDSIDNEEGILKKIQLLKTMKYINDEIQKRNNITCNCHK